MSGRLEEAVARAVKGIPTKPSAVGGPQQGGSSHPKRLRDRHHTIARMVAAKMPDERICLVMGMTQRQLDLLKDQTPAFAELVYHYEQRPPRAEREEEYLEQKHRIAKMAQLELHDRLVEEPEKFSSSELLRIQDSYDDRTGFSKMSVNVQVNADLAARLEHNRRTRQRALAGAGEGGGASSQPLGSAPPLLELKAEPPPLEPVAIAPHPTEPPAPLMAEKIQAGRSRPVPGIRERIRRV